MDPFGGRRRRMQRPRFWRGRRVPTRRINPLLPVRPKKVPTAYGLFVKDYWAFHNNDREWAQANPPPEGINFNLGLDQPVFGIGPRRSIRNASQIWRGLNVAQRDEYRRRAEVTRVAYRQSIGEWKEVKQSLKKPASAFALFLKDVWERERLSGRRIADMGRFARLQWMGLSVREKNEYTQRYHQNVLLYNRKIQLFRQNGRMPTEEELNPVNDGQQAEPGIPTAEEGDVEEDEDAEEEDSGDDDDDDGQENDGQENDVQENGGQENDGQEPMDEGDDEEVVLGM